MTEQCIGLRKPIAILKTAALFLAAVIAGAPASAALPLEIDGAQLPSLAPMIERASPSVVNIATYTTVQVRNPLLEDPFFRRFFRVPESRRYSQRRTQSAGSGVVVDAANGYIITNHHVIDRADEINVVLSDGRSLQASLVGSDAQVDLAVLKVEATGLNEINFADSSKLRVGDFAVAIGNPFGLNQTVTSGIVSALERSGLGIEGFEDFIQTDASINPGNSGGALVNLRGELIGINTAIFTPAGGNVGIGFAIPSNMVREVMLELIENRQVRRAYLGLDVQNLNPELAEAFAVATGEGVVVTDVEPGSLADEAGIKPGDILTRIDGRPIETEGDYNSTAAVIFVGDQVIVEVLRASRKKTFRINVDAEAGDNVSGERLDKRLDGVRLQNFRSDDSSAAGVLVIEVSDGSMAFGRGLRAGDIIVAANRQAVTNVADLAEGARRSKSQLLLRVYRNGQYGYIAIR